MMITRPVFSTTLSTPRKNDMGTSVNFAGATSRLIQHIERGMNTIAVLHSASVVSTRLVSPAGGLACCVERVTRTDRVAKRERERGPPLARRLPVLERRPAAGTGGRPRDGPAGRAPIGECPRG